MLKKFIISIANWAFKLLLKYGIIRLVRILLIILIPLYITALVQKRLLPICVFISLLCMFLAFWLIYL